MGFFDKKVIRQITDRLQQIWPQIPLSQLTSEYRSDGRDMIRVELPGNAALDLAEGMDGAWYAVPVVEENGEFIPVAARRPYFFGLRTTANPDQVAEHFYEEVRAIGRALSVPEPEPAPVQPPIAARPPAASHKLHPFVPFPDLEEDPFLEFQRDFATVALAVWNHLSSFGLDVRLDIEEGNNDQGTIASLTVESSGLPTFQLSVKNGFWFFSTNQFSKARTFFPPPRVAQARNDELLAAIIAAQIVSMWIDRRRPETPHWKPGFKIDRDATGPGLRLLQWLATGGTNDEDNAFEGTPASAAMLLEKLDRAIGEHRQKYFADNEPIDSDLVDIPEFDVTAFDEDLSPGVR